MAVHASFLAPISSGMVFKCALAMYKLVKEDGSEPEGTVDNQLLETSLQKKLMSSFIAAKLHITYIDFRTDKSAIPLGKDESSAANNDLCIQALEVHSKRLV